MAEDKIIPDTDGAGPAEQVGFLTSVVNEIIYSPLNLVLVGVITLLVYKIFRSRQQPAAAPAPEPELPRLRKDFTVAELRQFDGTQADGRVLVAVNGSVYDVTKGKRFYGPGGPYAAFGGRDASRGLATFSVTSNEKEEYDDLSDLTQMEMESVKEWEMQFKEKYILVGRLLKPGEQPTNYSDEDEETPNESTPTVEPAKEKKPAPPASPKKTPAAAATAASTETTTTGSAGDAPSKAEDLISFASAGDDSKPKDEWRPSGGNQRSSNNNNNSVTNATYFDGGEHDEDDVEEQDEDEDGEEEQGVVHNRAVFDQHSICDMFGF